MNMKPCYFCGSTKTSVKARKTNHYMHETIVASVRCNSCKSRGPVASGNVALGSYGEELRGGVTYSEAKQDIFDKAVELWNRRIVIENT